MKSTYNNVRRYRVSLTAEQIQQHETALLTQNELWNYAVKYLENHFGYRHLSRMFPTKVMAKKILVNEIKARFELEHYLKGSLHSQAANEFLTTLLTNYGEYRKVLYKASRMSDQEKSDYKRNIGKHRNARHQSWYRKGSLGYLRNHQTSKTVSLPNNNQIEVLSAHHIKIQAFGDVRVIENISNLKGQDIRISKLKRKNDGTYELQLVLQHVKHPKKYDETNSIGADWNMIDNQAFTTTDNRVLTLSDKVIAQADFLEEKIKQLDNQIMTSTWLGVQSKRMIGLRKECSKLFAKRSNVLDEHYKQIANELIADNEAVIIEDLDSKQMRKEKGKRLNHKLALIKPYRLSQFIEGAINRKNKTLIKIDPYKTSQVEFGTNHIEKHSVNSAREWISTETGKLIKRDENSSANIKDWGLHPNHHQAVVEGKKTIKQVATVI
jgi:putative transposase